jgi:hypothetical protein
LSQLKSINDHQFMLALSEVERVATEIGSKPSLPSWTKELLKSIRTETQSWSVIAQQLGPKALDNPTFHAATTQLQTLFERLADYNKNPKWLDRKRAEQALKDLTAIKNDFVLARSSRTGEGENQSSTTDPATRATRDLIKFTSPANNSTADLKKLIQTVQAEIHGLRTNGATLLSELQKELSAEKQAQTERQQLLRTREQELADILAEFRQKLQTALDSAGSHVETLKTQLQSADDLMTRLKSYDKEATELLGVIGAKGTSEGFKQAAEGAMSSKRIWHVVTSICILAAATWGILLVAMPSLRGETIWGVVGRLAVATPFFLLAGYAASQAAHARQAELQLRRTALELAALPPFMAPLPEEKAQELRALMARRTFGREHPGEKLSDSPPALLDSVVNKDLAPLLIQALIQALQKKEKS